MARKKEKEIEIDVSTLKDGESRVLTNVNGNYVLSDKQSNAEYIDYGKQIEKASFDFIRAEHIYNKVIQMENSSYITTFDDLLELAKNPQNDIAKINKINGICQYYVNKDDIIGKVVEIVENNINTNYSINYPNLPKEEDNTERKNEIEKLIMDFNRQIDIEQLIKDNILITYMEGNFIVYLRGDSKNGYAVESYPLGLVEITEYKIDNEPIVSFDVSSLKQTLQKAQNKFKKLKSKSTIQLSQTIEDEILKNYPPEVGDAFKVRDNYCFLDPKRVGVNRVGNFRGLYGVTPIMKALNAQLLLDTYDNVDRKNAIAKSKKIYNQILRAELLDNNSSDLPKNSSKVKYAAEMGYAHGNLLAAMQKDVVLLTSPPYVEKLEIVEPKTVETNPENILLNRNRVLNALGIGYLSNEVKSSFNTVNVNADELLKKVNRISKNLESVINKFYKVVCEENNIDVIYAPTIIIQPTEYLDKDSKFKLIDLLYSKIGASYKTVFGVLGKDFDYETEVRNRMEENEYMLNGKLYNLDEDVFKPHPTSYNSPGDSGEKSDSSDKSETDTKSVDDTIKEEENQNPDQEQKARDKNRYQNKKKSQK